MYPFYGSVYEADNIILGKKSDLSVDRSVDRNCPQRKGCCGYFFHPCNPTAVLQKREDVVKLIEQVDGLVIVDEAYMDFAETASRC
jgi:histidinol-phosphate aminotransferase